MIVTGPSLLSDIRPAYVEDMGIYAEYASDYGAMNFVMNLLKCKSDVFQRYAKYINSERVGFTTPGNY